MSYERARARRQRKEMVAFVKVRAALLSANRPPLRTPGPGRTGRVSSIEERRAVDWMRDQLREWRLRVTGRADYLGGRTIAVHRPFHPVGVMTERAGSAHD